MAVEDFYTLQVHLRSQGGPYSFGQNYVMTAGTVGPDTLREACEAFETLAITLLQDCTADDCEIDQITMEPFGGIDEVPGLLQLGTRPGLLVGDALPNNVSGIIHQLTDAPSSRFNGRIFMAGIPESQILNTIFIATWVDPAQLFATAIEGNLVVTGPPTATFQPGIISRHDAGVPREVPVIFDIVSNTVKNVPRQQRRRTTRIRGIN